MDDFINSGAAEVEQGIRHFQNGDHGQAFTCFLEGAHKGNPIAMNNLSVFYINGWAVKQDPFASCRWMEKAAEAGYVEAFYPIGIKYYMANGTERDLHKAVFWLSKARDAGAPHAEEYMHWLQEAQRVLQDPALDDGAVEFDRSIEFHNSGDSENCFRFTLAAANKGHAPAMNNVAFMLGEGIGTPADQEASFRWMLQAAQAGFEPSFYPTAQKYYSGTGTGKDLAQARFWAEKAAQVADRNQENAKNLLQVIAAASADDGKPEFNQAMDAYRESRNADAFRGLLESAKKGNLMAMNNLSIFFMDGIGTGKNPTASFIWMERAAQGGYADAFYPLAYKYAHGLGTAKNPAKAKIWAEKAIQAETSSREDARKLIQQLPTFVTVPRGASAFQRAMKCHNEKDYAGAREAFLEAADQGNATAMYNLSYYSLEGLACEKSQEDAFRWMKKAAEAGYENAYYYLACRYRAANGTEKDLIQAKFWAEKALQTKENGEDARKLLELMKSEAQDTDPTNLPVITQEQKERFRQAQRLFNSKQYPEALALLEPLGREGHPEALRVIGQAWHYGLGVERSYDKAVEFYTAAAFRGDREAVERIVKNITGGDYAGLWKAYAQSTGMEGCTDCFNVETMEERKRQTDPECWDGLSAMKRALRRDDRGDGPSPEYTYSRVASRYGNLDGTCVLANYLQKNWPEKPNYLKIYRMAAYMGHSYAMFRLANYYDTVDRATADACYRQAARWGYDPAVRICAQRNIAL